MQDWISETLGIQSTVQVKILITILFVLMLFLMRRLALKAALHRVVDPKIQYNWRKGTAYIGYFIGLVIIAPIWISELHSMGTFFGLLTAGLAIALKDPLSNFFAWIFILIKKPFEVGDRIQIGPNKGDLINIGFLQFELIEIGNWVEADQSTGRIIHIPNGLVFTQPVFNFNQAMKHIWHEIPILITFESNWVVAKQLLKEIADRHAGKFVDQVREQLNKADQKYTVVYQNVEPSVFTKRDPSGIMLTIRYLCHPRTRRGTEQLIIEDLLKSFGEHPDISFAYPTTRFYTD